MTLTDLSTLMSICCPNRDPLVPQIADRVTTKARNCADQVLDR